jgi:TRAP-type uncharacterized transport system substrate-binding protein
MRISTDEAEGSFAVDLAGRTVSLGAPASGAGRAMRDGGIDALLVAGGVPRPVLSGSATVRMAASARTACRTWFS